MKQGFLVIAYIVSVTAVALCYAHEVPQVPLKFPKVNDGYQAKYVDTCSLTKSKAESFENVKTHGKATIVSSVATKQQHIHLVDGDLKSGAIWFKNAVPRDIKDWRVEIHVRRQPDTNLFGEQLGDGFGFMLTTTNAEEVKSNLLYLGDFGCKAGVSGAAFYTYNTKIYGSISSPGASDKSYCTILKSDALCERDWNTWTNATWIVQSINDVATVYLGDGSGKGDGNCAETFLVGGMTELISGGSVKLGVLAVHKQNTDSIDIDSIRFFKLFPTTSEEDTATQTPVSFVSVGLLTNEVAATVETKQTEKPQTTEAGDFEVTAKPATDPVYNPTDTNETGVTKQVTQKSDATYSTSSLAADDANVTTTAPPTTTVAPKNSQPVNRGSGKYSYRIKAKVRVNKVKLSKPVSQLRSKRDTAQSEDMYLNPSDWPTEMNDTNSEIYKATQQTFIEQLVMLYQSAGFEISASDIDVNAISPIVGTISAIYDSLIQSGVPYTSDTLKATVLHSMQALAKDGAFQDAFGPDQIELLDVQEVSGDIASNQMTESDRTIIIGVVSGVVGVLILAGASFLIIRHVKQQKQQRNDSY